MRFGYREECLLHETGPRHPENPDRIRAIRRGLSGRHGVEYASPDPASVETVCAVHDTEYVEEVREFCAAGGGDWDLDTVACEGTWRAALASAGIARWVADAALATGRDRSDSRADRASSRSGDVSGPGTPFSLGRPPGHHAVADDAMGFCFFNNAAVAAQTAIDRGAHGVAVLDWDVHHGNGTQAIFYERGDVFYASIHERGLYPGTGRVDETGEGDGEGANVNVPLPPGSGDADYAAVLEAVVAPAVAEFDPDLVLVSAGFDAHEHDPISRMRVSTEGYGRLTARVRDLAGRVDAGLGFVLEGGYGLDTLADSVGTVHEVFHGYEPAAPTGEASDRVRAVIDEVRRQGFGEK